MPPTIASTREPLRIARSLAFRALLALPFAVASAAEAQTAGNSVAAPGCSCSDGLLAFEAADTDRDGLVSEAEFVRDAAVAFATLDKNGDGALTAAEFGPDYDAGKFSRIDANRDGKLTFGEVMAFKMQAFRRGDKNGDGHLSITEMFEEVGSEEGMTP